MTKAQSGHLFLHWITKKEKKNAIELENSTRGLLGDYLFASPFRSSNTIVVF